MMTSRALTEYVVLDIEGSRVTTNKFAQADAQVRPQQAHRGWLLGGQSEPIRSTSSHASRAGYPCRPAVLPATDWLGCTCTRLLPAETSMRAGRIGCKIRPVPLGNALDAELILVCTCRWPARPTWAPTTRPTSCAPTWVTCCMQGTPLSGERLSTAASCSLYRDPAAVRQVARKSAGLDAVFCCPLTEMPSCSLTAPFSASLLPVLASRVPSLRPAFPVQQLMCARRCQSCMSATNPVRSCMAALVT